VRSIARSAPLTASALVAAWPVLMDSSIEKDHFHSCRVMPWTTAGARRPPLTARRAAS
jgi:hypothetical protein